MMYRTLKSLGAMLATWHLLLSPGISLANNDLQMLDRIVAVVNNGAIMESELTRRVDDILQQLIQEGRQPPPTAVLTRQVLERMIVEEVQMQLADQAGIRIDDQTLNQSLSMIAHQNNMTLEEFAAQLSAEGMTWRAFREQVRREMAMSQLHQRRVTPRVRVTDRELERFMTSEAGRELFTSEFRLGHILIELPGGAVPEEIEAAQNKARQLIEQLQQGADFAELAMTWSNGPQALEGGDLGWRSPAQLPTLFAEAALALQPGDISSPLRAANGFHILKMMDRRGGDSKFVKQYQTRHILLRPSALRSPADTRRLADQLLLRLRAGEAFDTLAKEHSDDPGSAREGGLLGWVSPGDMTGPFEEMMLSSDPGKLSPVFETEFGWHILRVDDTRTADLSDEFRRQRARAALQQRRFEEELEQWLREARAEAFVEVRL